MTDQAAAFLLAFGLFFALLASAESSRDRWGALRYGLLAVSFLVFGLHNVVMGTIQ